jgi:hypothetical protein
MSYSRKAVPQTPSPKPEPEVRKYKVLSRRCVWGKKYEIVELALGDREEALLRAGTLERVPDEKPQARPLKSADKEG